MQPEFIQMQSEISHPASLVAARGSMPFSYYLRYLRILPRAIWFTAEHPLFFLRLLITRAAYTATRRFVGDTLIAPCGERIFNAMTLINYWATAVTREHGCWWHSIVRETVQPHIIDVGANVGMFGGSMRRLNPTAIIHSIEPQTELTSYLQKRSNTVHSCAAGSGQSKIELQLGDNWTAATLNDSNSYSNGSRIVPVETLDSIWDALGQPPVTVLKIDVDGAEMAVLNGARRMMRSVKVLVLEVNDQSVFNILPGGRTVNRHDYVWCQEPNGKPIFS